MDETDDFIDDCEPATQAVLDEKMRLKCAFGDDVAKRFLRLRGIEGDVMQEAVLERYAAKQALKIARDALAMAATPPLRHFQRAAAPAPVPADDALVLSAGQPL